MKTIVEFWALGLDPVPWSVPSVGVSRRGGKSVRFTRRAKKSDLGHGKASLYDWQALVRAAAVQAMAGVAPCLLPVDLHCLFYARTPLGHRHGEPWVVLVSQDHERADVWHKHSLRGRPEPDLVNLLKGTEDALKGVVFGDDVQTRRVTSSAWFGPQPGVRVLALAIEPGDYRGTGEPIL